MIRVFYRLSDHGYKKTKPAYVTNDNCLSNFVASCELVNRDWKMRILMDNVSQETYDHIFKEYAGICEIRGSKLGSGAQSFNKVLDYAIKHGSDDDIIYFVEDDYIHEYGWGKILKEGFEIGADYVSLYDHPDKYLNPQLGGNPYVEGGGEVTRLMKSDSCHWKLTNSTTMTFAAKLKTLKEDEDILRGHTSGTYPKDFDMFLALREKGRSLVTPVPGYATHGETTWLSPFKNWKQICADTNMTSLHRINHGISI